MSKKKIKKETTSLAANVAASTSKKESNSAHTIAWFKDPKIYGMLAALLLITGSLFSGTFKNDFTNWDDQMYVTENPNIDFSQSSLKAIFTTPVAGNIHPVTMLTLCYDYARAQFTPAAYHATSLYFHLANTLLLFLFIFHFTGRKWLVALLVALIFGIHPMHVESVAWVSGRKDVVYTFFFIPALWAYYEYFNTKLSNWYAIAIVLFVLSALSKPAAVMLPLVLLLMDFYKQGKIDWKQQLNKIPFLIVAIIMGVITLNVQSDAGAVGELEQYTIFQRFIFASYGFVMYIKQFVWPSNMSAFYPYPLSADVPKYSLFVLLAAAIFGAVFYSLKNTRVWFFGLMFYLVMIILVLQFLTVGSAILADRYTYVPYIGLAYVLAYYVNYLYENQKQLFMPTAGITVLFLAFLGYKTYAYVPVWNNSYELWTHTIQHYPTAGPAYKNRGKWFYEVPKDYNKALDDFDILVQVKPNDHESHLSRGNALMQLKRYDESIKEYTRSTELKSDYYEAWYSLARVQADANQYEASVASYNRALLIKPNTYDIYYGLGILNRKFKQPQKALLNYSDALRVKPNTADIYSNMGNVYFDMAQYDQSIENYSKALELNPENDNSLNNRASCYILLGQMGKAEYFPLAAKDLEKLITIQPGNKQAYANLVSIYNVMGDTKTAEAYRARLKAMP